MQQHFTSLNEIKPYYKLANNVALVTEKYARLFLILGMRTGYLF